MDFPLSWILRSPSVCGRRAGLLDGGAGSFALRTCPHFRHVLTRASLVDAATQHGAFPLRSVFWIRPASPLVRQRSGAFCSDPVDPVRRPPGPPPDATVRPRPSSAAPTTRWVEPSSTGNPRRLGALRIPGQASFTPASSRSFRSGPASRSTSKASRRPSPAQCARCVVARLPAPRSAGAGPIADATDDVGHLDSESSYGVQHVEGRHRHLQSPASDCPWR